MPESDDSIYDERLLRIRRHCPECHTILKPTGYLRADRLPGKTVWCVEYECPKEKETFQIWDIERKDLIESIVREAGKQ
jgi:hypothetical protein